MKLHAPQSVFLLGTALAMALGMGACSRSQPVSESLAGPARSGAGRSQIGGSGRAGDVDLAPSTPCPVLVPATLDAPVRFIPTSGLVASFRSNRLRIETIGEIAGPKLLEMGPCAATDNPSVRFIGGHADVFLHGTDRSVTVDGQPLTFGPMLFPGAMIEPGIVICIHPTGSVQEIIWPELAGLGPGDPIVRVQLARWNPLLVSTAQSYDIVWDITAEQDGTQMSFKGHADNLRLDGIAVAQEGANFSPPACPETLAGTDGAVVSEFASIVQFRANRLRLEVNGDLPSGIMNATGLCAAASVPSISYVGGSANLFRAGTNISVTSTAQPISFGPLLPPLILEPGVVLNIEPTGNVLEIIWPGLAGLPPGPPILRFQLSSWNSWVRTGQLVDVRMRFDAMAADGVVASYTAEAKSVVVPALR